MSEPKSVEEIARSQGFDVSVTIEPDSSTGNMCPKITPVNASVEEIAREATNNICQSFDSIPSSIGGKWKHGGRCEDHGFGSDGEKV